MKSTKNEDSRTENFDAESTNRPISEKVSRPLRRFETTSSRDKSSTNTESTSHRRTVSADDDPTNRSISEKVRRFEKTPSRDKSSTNSESRSHRRITSDSPSDTGRTEVLSSLSSHSNRPGAVAVTGTRGNGDHETWTSPDPSEEIVDVETGGNRNGFEVISHRLVEGEEDNSVVRQPELVVMETMIHAELVTPPVEALRVTAEEDSNFPSEYQHHSSPDDSQSDSADKDSSTLKGKGILQRQWGRFHWTVLALLLVLMTCAIVFPLIFPQEQPEDDPPFPPGCLQNTTQILEAQVTFLKESAVGDESLVLTMCHGARVNVGVFKDAENGDLRFARGDYPLTLIRPNVVIQCGSDGKRENDCVLNGGLRHVTTFENATLPDGTKLTGIGPLHNITIRGMTFTGEIQPESGAVSVFLRHSSQNIHFEDCRWTNMRARRGLIHIREDDSQPNIDPPPTLPFMPPGATASPTPSPTSPNEVTVSNCVFQDIVYDEPLIRVVNQKLTVENSIFRNIHVSSLAENRCRHIYSAGETTWSDDEFNYSDGCASLLSCSPQSICSLRDSCVENMEYKGPGLVVAHETYGRNPLHYTGLYLDPSSETQCELALFAEGLNDASAPNCSKIFTETACQVASH